MVSRFFLCLTFRGISLTGRMIFFTLFFMCYDISFKVKIPELADYLPGLTFDDQIRLDFLGSDHVMGHAYPVHPIVYLTKDGKMMCRLMEWGVIPFYTKDEKAFARQRPSMLNARAERILDDPKSYWSKIKDHRCLIPVTGIYEHRGIAGWKKKVPYYICLPDQSVFFLPGLYSVAELPDLSTGELQRRYTFTLITRAANSLLAQIHNDGEHRFRMPLFLPLNLAMEWVASELPAEQYRRLLGFEMPSEAFGQHPVFTIRSPKGRPDRQDKTAFWAWDKLPPLGEGNPVIDQ